MANLNKSRLMPTNLKYKFLATFCLTSLVPLLVGVYIASLFIKYPFNIDSTNLLSITLVLIFTFALSFLGYVITRQIHKPISHAAEVAKKIAAGHLEIENVSSRQGIDELDELSQSLRTISNNARELLDRVEKLSMKDKLTGLYNMTYLLERLNEEIQRAIHYQRPCSFAYFHIDNFLSYAERKGSKEADILLKNLASAILKELSEFDRAARVSANEFVIILPDRNKKHAIEYVEKLLKILHALPAIVADGKEEAPVTIRAGISENPIDGVNADMLFAKAKNRMISLNRHGNNLIEAFV